MLIQIQMVAGQEPLIGEGVQMMSGCLQGNIPDDAAIAAYTTKLGV